MAKSFNLTPPAPAAAFLSAQQPAKQAAPAADRVLPEGYELKPVPKSKRLNLLIRPTTHDRLSEVCAAATAMAGNGKKLSVNELINRILEDSLESLDPAQLARSLGE